MAATDMRNALTQAQSLGTLMQALWIQPPTTELWRTCSRALLAQFLDFGFRIYAAIWLHGHQHSEWAAVHQQVMQDVLEGSARVTINTAGRLVVFDGSPVTRTADLDGDHRQDTMIVSQDDAGSLLTGATPVTSTADLAVAQLDFSFPDCGALAQSASAVPSAPAGSPMASVPPSAPPQPPVAMPPSAPAPTPPPAAPVSSVPQDLTSPSPAPLLPAGGEESTPPPLPAPGTQAAAASRVTPEIRQRVRAAFEGFIGNEPAVSRLSNDLLRALGLVQKLSVRF